MQHFTQDEFMPNPATILFLKQFARMCNSKKQVNHGYRLQWFHRRSLQLTSCIWTANWK